MLGRSVKISIDSAVLEGDFAPPISRGNAYVIFAHGSGSSRLSPRNIEVANVLRKVSIGTLLFDLLTEEEDQDYENRFNVDLLTERLVAATLWLTSEIKSEWLRIGYFGASTGAAAALKAAASLGSKTIRAVVSRGGRPDIVMTDLPRVTAPTLLIVGERDEEVLDLNSSALEQLGSPKKKLVVVPSATHLFEEPGALDKVAQYAAEWFSKYL